MNDIDPQQVALRRDHPRIRHADGPPLAAVGAAHLALVVLSVVALALLGGAAQLASPLAPWAEVVARLRAAPEAWRSSGFLLVGAALPLLIATATLSTRLQRLGARVPGPTISLAGGILAAGTMLLSGLLSLAAARPEVLREEAAAPLLAMLAFLVGGPGYAMALGLFLAGAAVPLLILRLVPRGIAAAGLLLAVLGELTWVSLLVDGFQVLVPVVRFGAAAWIVGVGATLPASRRSGVRG